MNPSQDPSSAFNQELLALFRKYGVEDIPVEKAYGNYDGVSLCIGNKVAVTISYAGWNFGDGFMPGLTYVMDDAK